MEKKKKRNNGAKDCIILLLAIVAVICGSGVVESMLNNPTPLSVGIFVICFVYLLLVTIANSL